MQVSSATSAYAYGSTTAGGGSASGRGSATAAGTLTPQQQQQVAELQQTDREVRAHEAAHMAAGRGVVTSGASYTYTYGPDGKRYAVGGEVGIDTSPEQKPADNIEKGAAIQDAALAPRNPSSQDYRVASIGARLENRGRIEQARLQAEEATSAGNAGNASGAAAPPADAAATRRERVAAAYAAAGTPAAGPQLDLFA